MAGTDPPWRVQTGRLAFLVASRRAAETIRPALTVRIIALTVVLTMLVQLEDVVSIVSSLPAVAICMLRARSAPPAGTISRRRRWILVSWLDLLSALLVVAVAAWCTVALAAPSRFLALCAATVLLTVVSARLALDPRWYRPDPRPRRVARMLRALASPLGLIACLALALPAPWEPGERTIVVIVCLLPMATVALTRDQQLTVQNVVEMIQTEAQDGRQSVLDELHGGMSANLRLLEQASHELRDSCPRLYELAVGANSRLRETLTLADPLLESAARPQTLSALVRTLAMAVGARGELTVDVDRLSDADRDLLRLVLNDTVGVVLSDGASRVGATVRLVAGSLVVSVVGGSSRGPDRIARLGQLRRRIDEAGGSVAEEPAGPTDVRRAVVVRWPASAGTA